MNSKALGTNLFSYRKPVKGEGKKKCQMECFHPQNILLSSHYVNERTMIDMVSFSRACEETLETLGILTSLIYNYKIC